MENNTDDFKLFLENAEYPFVREDMTKEEFDEEFSYWIHHYKDIRKGTYKPLWKQRVTKIS